MAKVIGQPSATPILDLLKPMPEPDVERITGRFAFPFLTVVAAIVVTENYSFLVVPFGFLAVNFLAIGIHELGHLVAGRCVGLRFERIIFVSGGPVAGILFGIAAVLTGEISLARYDSAWPTFLEFLGAWSLLIGSLSLIPFRTRGFANDAMLLRVLLFSKPEAVQMVASYALSISKGNNLFPKQFQTAIKELDRALSLIREAPESIQRQRLEAAWVSWRQEIQQHLPVEVA